MGHTLWAETLTWSAESKRLPKRGLRAETISAPKKSTAQSAKAEHMRVAVTNDEAGHVNGAKMVAKRVLHERHEMVWWCVQWCVLVHVCVCACACDVRV